MSHTPGPWEQSGLAVQVLGRGIICSCPTPKTNGVFECEANARLIAAAPGLLKALESYHDTLCDGEDCDVCPIIAKAKGESE